MTVKKINVTLKKNSEQSEHFNRLQQNKPEYFYRIARVCLYIAIADLFHALVDRENKDRTRR